MTERNIHIFSEIATITEKSILATALAEELAGYSIYDMMKISAGLDREINLLPSPYRERSRAYFTEQLFGRYTKVMKMQSDGDFNSMKGEIADLSLYRNFCDMESKHLEARLASENDSDEAFSPFHSFYYLTISCFYMFVLDEPGHPVGTPFPGGFTVRQQGDKHYCPIRDKEKDVEYSICNFCPARQDERNR
jgi:uncharacterized protein (UPF0305 family)